MTVNVSLVALTGIALFFLLRSRYLGYGSAVTAVMFGFFLANSGAAGAVTHLTTAILNALPSSL